MRNHTNWKPSEDDQYRFWPNDYGATLTGLIDYDLYVPVVPDDTNQVEKYVGIVDNYCGGMILWCPADEIEYYCDLLNANQESYHA